MLQLNNYQQKQQLGNITCYQADCMDLMTQMPDKYFELAITDPPYFPGPDKLGYFGVEYSQTKVKRQNYKILGDWTVPSQEYFDQLKRVSKEQIIWGINYFKIMNLGSGRIIWDKKNDESTFSKCEIAYNSQHEHVSLFRYMWNGMLQGDMKNKEIRHHPTQKPARLYTWLLTKYAKQGDKILDTHFGSLSIGIACHDLGFELTAIEKDASYYNSGVKRLEEHMKQGKLQL